MADRLDTAIADHRVKNNKDTRIAYTGTGTGNGDPRARDGSGMFYVRYQLADRFSAPVLLPLGPSVFITVADNVPVIVGWNQHLGPCILGEYSPGVLLSGRNPASSNPLDTQVHGQTQTTDITQFQCKRSMDTSKPLYVVVKPGYIEINGVSNVFLSAEIDLSSFVPATGERVIACVFLKDDLTLEAFASTPKLITDAITAADIDECRQAATSTSISIWGWILDGDITSLDEDPTKNIDLRPFFSAGTGTTGTLAIDDGSTTVSNVTSITFTGATVTDLTGGAAQVAVTGGSQVFPETALMWHDQMKVIAGTVKNVQHDTQQNYATWTYQYNATGPVNSANGDQFTQPFMLAAGTYNFNVLGVEYNVCAKIDWEWSDDGVTWNTITTGQDWYHAATAVYNVVKTTSSVVISTSGWHILRGTINGRNAGNSTAYDMYLTKYWFDK